MCLGELAQVTSVVGDGTAEVLVRDRRTRVSLLTLEGPLGAGDWLLVHSGFALARLTEAEAADARLLRTEEGNLR